MPISERRLNIKYIQEYLERVREASDGERIVTADKPLLSKPAIQSDGKLHAKPNYASKTKSRK